MTISALGRRRWPRCWLDVIGFADTLKKAERPLVLVGAGALARPDGAAVAALAAKTAIEVGAVKADWNGFSVSAHCGLARGCARYRISFPGAGGLTATQNGGDGRSSTLVFLLGADEIEIAHGLSSSISAPMATVARIAPTSSCRAPPIRRNPAIYVNTEGRVQMAERAVLPTGRRARGLGDPARALRRARPQAAL